MAERYSRRRFAELGVKSFAGAILIYGARYADRQLYNTEDSLSYLFRHPEIPSSIAPEPPKGVNTWNVFGGNITPDTCKEQMRAMRDLGLVQAGYTIFIPDDGLAATSRNRDQGYKTTVPDAINDLASFARKINITPGWYLSIGENTCEGRIGSYNHQRGDIKRLADAGIGYLKADKCFVTGIDTLRAFGEIRAAVDTYAPQMIVEVCDKSEDAPLKNWEWRVGSVRRVRQDIKNTWKSVVNTFVLSRDSVPGMSKGHWNHFDSLEVGNGVLTSDEEKAHFGLWATMHSPLFISTDLTKLSSDRLALLKNPDLLALQKDSAAFSETENRILIDEPKTGVYHILQPVSGGIGFTIFNTTDQQYTLDLFYDRKALGDNKYMIRDLVAMQNIGEVREGFNISASPHGARVTTIKPV